MLYYTCSCVGKSFDIINIYGNRLYSKIYKIEREQYVFLHISSSILCEESG